MAATYDDDELSPKDRVRGLMGDVSAPAVFSDGRIASALGRLGVADAIDPGNGDPVAEVSAAIALLETQVVTTGRTRTIRQGSVSRTQKDADSGGYDQVIANLRRRLAELVGAGAGIAVVRPHYPDLERRHGYPSYEDPWLEIEREGYGLG